MLQPDSLLEVAARFCALYTRTSCTASVLQFEERFEEGRCFVDDTQFRNVFLCDKGGDSDHCKTAVGDFLLLHVELALTVLRVDIEGVPPKVTWEVIGLVLVSCIDLFQVDQDSSCKDHGPINR